MVWHERYDRADSPHAKRLEVVRGYIDLALRRCSPGPIRIISMCAGDGRDILGTLRGHPRSSDVSGLLVEAHPELVARARSSAPVGINAWHGDAGRAGSYADAAPADLLLCCGVFGNISDSDIRNTIASWPMLCGPGGRVIWTRHGREPDMRSTIREWVSEGGFEEEAYDGPVGGFGVGLARMTAAPTTLDPSARLFDFLT